MLCQYEVPHNIQPAVEDAIRSVAVLKDRHQKNSSVTELELRFGSQSSTGRFETGVQYEFFTCVQVLLDSFPEFEKIHDWQEVIDYHFLDKKNKSTRSRVASENASIQIETVHKERVSDTSSPSFNQRTINSPRGCASPSQPRTPSRRT